MVVTQKILAHQLADACRLEPEVADSFITDFFAAIEAALVDEGEVRIKGLGRFYVAEGSVHFLPVDELAAAVNAPFAFFSPMKLNDDELPEENKKVTPSVTAVETVAPMAEEIAPSAAVETVAPLPDEVTPSAAVETAAPLPDDAAPTDASDDSDESAVEPEPTVVHHYHHRRGMSVLSGLLIFIVGLVGGTAIGYLLHDNIRELINNNHNITPKQNIIIDADTVTIVKPASVIVEKQTKTDTAHNDSVKQDQTAKQIPAERPKRYDTVGGRVYLATLARRYYGHSEYWVYIYDANKLKHPDRVNPGKRLLIPYLEDVRTSADDALNLKQAKQRGADIYNSLSRK